jgi:hypothetical protein
MRSRPDAASSCSSPAPSPASTSAPLGAIPRDSDVTQTRPSLEPPTANCSRAPEPPARFV